MPKLGKFDVSFKAGGSKTYTNYDDVRDDFLSGALHPSDLKPALAAAVNVMLEPVRQHFKTDPVAKELLAKMEKYMKERAAKANAAKKTGKKGGGGKGGYGKGGGFGGGFGGRGGRKGRKNQNSWNANGGPQGGANTGGGPGNGQQKRQVSADSGGKFWQGAGKKAKKGKGKGKSGGKATDRA